VHGKEKEECTAHGARLLKKPRSAGTRYQLSKHEIISAKK